MHTDSGNLALSPLKRKLRLRCTGCFPCFDITAAIHNGQRKRCCIVLGGLMIEPLECLRRFPSYRCHDCAYISSDLAAHDAAAARVLWAVKTVVSIPASLSVVFSHRLIVSASTGRCGVM